jgi:endonuclease/exonuclease/phosphatase family metal-dependent hydrolase
MIRREKMNQNYRRRSILAAPWRRFAATAMTITSIGCAMTPNTSTAQLEHITAITWNLGWHLSQAEAAEWINECGKMFKKNAAGSAWVQDDSGEKSGWQLDFSRTARVPVQWDISQRPPCNVYQQNFRTVAATVPAYATRIAQARKILQGPGAADVMAFQEVSGAQAVKEVLGAAANDYHVCSFENFKVQRLAFAWRKSLGGSSASCRIEPSLSLPAREVAQQPRPGLELTLEINSKKIRFFNVHLKSSCVSPLANGDDLAGSDANCQILQDQVVPLENWLESRSANVDQVVALGDFNRNLAHEAAEPASQPVRVGTTSAPSDPLPAGAKVRNLFKEVNDGVPGASALNLVDITCPKTETTRSQCAKSKTANLSSDERNELANPTQLGCRNPIGLDHVLVGSNLRPASAEKIPLGNFGRSAHPTATRPEPFLAVSDHCPVLVRVRLGGVNP